tara:strand:+ start:3134 stop:3262 length:129 start_codon:yes stop_codon:yes gene_type:complete
MDNLPVYSAAFNENEKSAKRSDRLNNRSFKFKNLNKIIISSQ